MGTTRDRTLNSRNGAAMTRREVLKNMLLSAAGLALFDPWEVLSAAPAAPGTPRIPRKTAGTAKSVIQIWMWGGPCHIDTFDPKPGAGRDYCGPLSTAIPTNVGGISINGSLPLLAKQADKYSIIRSMTHGVNAHETASYVAQTGREPGREVFPSAGAVTALFKGYDHGYRGSVPPYVVLTEPQGRFSEAGFLGGKYKPFATGGDPNRDPFAVEGIVAPGISDERQHKRRDLLHSLDTLGKAMPGHPQFAALDKCEAAAYDLMFGDVKKLFDLTAERENVREDYGRNTFGQSCLMARRLVEAGVPYVTINYKGWDTHKRHFQIMNQKLPEMDKAMSALLQDLAARGLLDTTIVWWSGEFGRTPKVQWEPPWNGGRGHYGDCFAAVLAGGGFKGGHVVGASDAQGEHAVERPVTPRDLLASIYERLGIDPDGPLPNEAGVEATVLPASKGNGRLKEIMPT